jgi:hypothetical protein
MMGSGPVFDTQHFDEIAPSVVSPAWMVAAGASRLSAVERSPCPTLRWCVALRNFPDCEGLFLLPPIRPWLPQKQNPIFAILLDPEAK